ncbi:unnamed protein product, partial [marine sediment metagenome]
LLNLIPTPYFLVIPGQAINLSENITVENGSRKNRDDKRSHQKYRKGRSKIVFRFAN